jgi:hypothetical protein
VVLVTLGGCHLLDGLVVVSVKARKKDCVVLRRSDCEGYCAHPAGAAKSNSSRARRERATSGSAGSSARACSKHSSWESVTYGTPLARGFAVTLELVSTGTSMLAST